MLLKNSLVGLAAAATPALAWIQGIVAPPTVQLGSTVQVTLITGIYVQNYENFGIIWGVQFPPYYDGIAGRELGWTNLKGPGATQMPSFGNFTVDVTIPGDLGSGEAKLMAVMPILVGAMGTTQLVYQSAIVSLTP